MQYLLVFCRFYRSQTESANGALTRIFIHVKNTCLSHYYTQIFRICEKFKIHTEAKKATKLKELSSLFLESPNFEGKSTGKVSS